MISPVAAIATAGIKRIRPVTGVVLGGNRQLVLVK